MAQHLMVIRAKLSWWVMPYVHLALFFAQITNRELDLDKVGAVVMRGVKIELVGKK